MHKLGMYMSIWSKQAKAIKIMLDLKKEIHCPYRLICEAIDSLCQGCCVCNLPYCLSSWRRNDNPRLQDFMKAQIQCWDTRAMQQKKRDFSWKLSSRQESVTSKLLAVGRKESEVYLQRKMSSLNAAKWLTPTVTNPMASLRKVVIASEPLSFYSCQNQTLDK